MMSTQVYKLGGSLLDLPDLPARLRRLLPVGRIVNPSEPNSVGRFAKPSEPIWDGLENRPTVRETDGITIRPTTHAHRPLLVVGGGSAADLVRGWDRLHRLGDEQAHWLALESLRLNESLLARLLPETQIVASRPAAEAAWSEGRWPILSAYDFFRAEEAEADIALPHSWDVTSDSIAAWIALRWPADGLVLLKSRPLPAGIDLRHDLAPPLVDPHFRDLAPRLPAIEWVDLRSSL